MSRGAGDPDPVEALAERWRDEAAVLERHGHEGQAERLRIRAEEMADAVARRRDRRGTVGEAAELSGFSEKHLRKLYRDGELRGEQPSGTGGRILFRVRNLPRKPTPPPAAEKQLERAASSS